MKLRTVLVSILVASGIAGCGADDTSSSSGTNLSPTSMTPPSPPPPPPPAPTPPAPPPALVSVSATIAHVPEQPIRFQNLTKYQPHDTRYPFKTAWGECITLSAAQSPAIEATCEVRVFRLLELDSTVSVPTGQATIVGDSEFARHSPVNGQAITCALIQTATGSYRYGSPCVGANFHRATCSGGSCATNWYMDTDPSDGSAGSFFPGDNMRIVDGSLVIDASRHPDRVAHWWTLSPFDPTYRAPSRAGKQYVVEIEFRTIGAAALRIGLDRWTGGADAPAYVGECNHTGDPNPYQNCEDYNSDWYQTNSLEWAVVRLPLF